MARNTNKKTGIVLAYNVSPRGSYEGLLLKNAAKVIQINFPQEWGLAVADLAQPGHEIEAEVEPEESQHAHPVYRLLSIASDRQNKLALHLVDGAAPHDFSGKIARLNFALHGEVNGAVLESGDFLHLKPEGAAALKICVGMKVAGTGSRRPMVGGQYVIEAHDVNGVHLEKKPKPKKKTIHK